MGEEKVHKLLECDADVTVISPDITDGVSRLADAGRVTWVRRPHEAGDLDDAFLAIVADTSDSELNGRVNREAFEKNVSLNVADVTHLCSFITPAVVRRGDVTVAISTGGASPALARSSARALRSGPHKPETRRDGVRRSGPVLAEARAELRRRGFTPNGDHWQACLTDELVDLVQAGKAEEALDTLKADLLIGADCDCEWGVCRMWEELQISGGVAPLLNPPVEASDMATPRRVVVGSRTSPLSLSQTEEILRPLRTQFPESEFVVVPISTRGDRSKDAPLLSMDRGMFRQGHRGIPSERRHRPGRPQRQRSPGDSARRIDVGRHWTAKRRP